MDLKFATALVRAMGDPKIEPLMRLKGKSVSNN